ncbi:MAG: PLP-dependent cysteine synthase family protein [Spirochaetaceae bacterium]|nr:PLP-dependent cysteine synthase family protein [Spirochaetaceae bacterium]
MSILDLVGNTPLIALSRFAALSGNIREEVSLFAKAEFLNPSGSVKDRAVRGIVKAALASGLLRHGKTLVDSSSGNTGIGYAMAGAALGFPVKIFLPANANSERKRMLRILGAEIVETNPLEGSDGAYLAVRAEVESNKERYFYSDQYSNAENWRAHYLNTAAEIWQQTDGKITHFVAIAGTSGTFIGTSRRLKELNPKIKCLLVQPDSPFHGIEGTKHLASALPVAIFDKNVADSTIEVNTEESYRAARELAISEGVFAGISAGANCAAARRLCAELSAPACVVTVLCDSGSRYLSEDFWEAV